jgi:hypothetical protein
METATTGDRDMPATFGADIRPLFRGQDIACMGRAGVRLDDAAWMCDAAAGHGFADHGNARIVHARLAAGNMPPDGAWPADRLAAYQQWMSDGFQP